MREKAQRSGVGFRPHVKTHKTLEAARLQFDGGTGPITVSTLAEAEFFSGHGFDDITYAVPIGLGKLPRAAALARQIKALNLLIDSFEALRALEDFHRRQGTRFNVFLKVDCGYHRAGVDPGSREGLQLAQAMAESSSIQFCGLLTHAGHSYHAHGSQEIRAIAAQETSALTVLRDKITSGSQLVRSIGSTPTCAVVEKLTDADEARPGNYVFFDAFQSAIGSCTLEQCAVSVLTTVIGHYPQHGHLLIDAGALALSKDAGPDHIDPHFGFGVVCGLDLRALPMKLKVLSQEHGKIEAAPEVIAQFAIGTRLRIVPNHSCLTAAMYDVYQVLEQGRIVAQWHPVRGW
jgi:D-serine deaminase-like pyridoxal phosphate-dependent protein